MSKPLVTAILTITLMSVGLSQGGNPSESYLAELKSSVSKGVEALGSAEFDIPSTVNIEKAGDDYVAKLPLQGEARKSFLIASLNQELVEEQKHELVIKVLIHNLKNEDIKADDCPGIGRFLRRYQAADIDSSLVAALAARDLSGSQMLNATNLNSAWLCFLKRSGGAREVLSQRLLSHAGNQSDIDNTTWTDTEQRNINDAISAYKTELLALRLLNTK